MLAPSGCCSLAEYRRRVPAEGTAREPRRRRSRLIRAGRGQTVQPHGIPREAGGTGQSKTHAKVPGQRRAEPPRRLASFWGVCIRVRPPPCLEGSRSVLRESRSQRTARSSPSPLPLSPPAQSILSTPAPRTAAGAPLFGGRTALPARLRGGVEVQLADGSKGPLGVAVQPRKMGAKCTNALKLTRSEHRARWVSAVHTWPRPRRARGGGAQVPLGAGLWGPRAGKPWEGAPWSRQRGTWDVGPSWGSGAPRTHPEPALALAAAVGQLHLAQGDGVDEPVDQLLTDLLRGAL